MFVVATVCISKMPDRFKVTKTDAPEIEATFNSILKDDEVAARGKLLPTPVSTDKKGESKVLNSFYFCFLFYLLRIGSADSVYLIWTVSLFNSVMSLTCDNFIRIQRILYNLY